MFWRERIAILSLARIALRGQCLRDQFQRDRVFDSRDVARVPPLGDGLYRTAQEFSGTRLGQHGTEMHLVRSRNRPELPFDRVHDPLLMREMFSAVATDAGSL